MGAVTGHGIGVYPLWEGVVAGKTSIALMRRLDPGSFGCRFSSEVTGYSAKELIPKSYRKFLKVMARDTELAVGAAKFAVEDAGLITRAAAGEGGGELTYPSGRTGCNIGAGLIAAETLELTTALSTAVPAGAGPELTERTNGFSYRAWGTVAVEEGEPVGGMNNLPPLWMLKYLPNMLACHVTIIHGAEGPSNTITCAEASGLLSIGESSRIIERDAADVCLAGSAESKLSVMGVLRLDLAGRLAHTGMDADPAGIVRPYDERGLGTVPGEAGAILVLEEKSSAAKRGAKVYAQVAGFGAGHDTGDCIPPITNPNAVNEGLECAIGAALRDAGITPDDVDAIVPQASGIPSLDAGEAGALRKIFGAGLAKKPMVTLPPLVGDCSAGSGAVQVVVAAMAIAKQTLPARIHAGSHPADLDVGPAPSRPARLRNVLVCSSALGGQCGALVLRSVD
jgi:3-oxoacyl-[acyl-carrier-protein] synthase II